MDAEHRRRMSEVGLPAGAREVLAAYSRLRPRLGRPVMAAEVARAVGCNLKTITGRVASLRACGLLVPVASHKGGALYELAPDALRRAGAMPAYRNRAGKAWVLAAEAADVAREMVEDGEYPSYRLVADRLGVGRQAGLRLMREARAAGLWPDHAISSRQRAGAAARLYHATRRKAADPPRPAPSTRSELSHPRPIVRRLAI